MFLFLCEEVWSVLNNLLKIIYNYFLIETVDTERQAEDVMCFKGLTSSMISVYWIKYTSSVFYDI